METGRFTYEIRTMGCKANVYDSLVLERELEELGGRRAVEGTTADLFLLNSCTVTASADREALNTMKRVKERAPQSVTVMTGCLAQVAPDRVREQGSDLVVTNFEKPRLKAMVAERLGLAPMALDRGAGLTVDGADLEVFWGQLPSSSMGHTRAFLKIQEGCNDYCTYCIIPYARGKSRSVALGDVLSEVKRLVTTGVREVVLTGTNIADYGLDRGLSFDDLVEAILQRTAIERLRLSSLDPTEISDRLLAVMAQDGGRLMPHLHVSLQSPVSRVLRAMKRQYSQGEIISCLEKIHGTSANIFVGMDIIAGFPSETEEEHREGLALLERLPWARLHVFPYSERQGTPAIRIKGSVPQAVRKKRAQELMALSTRRHERFASAYIGQIVDGALLESPHESMDGVFVPGHLPNYVRVLVRADSGEHARSLTNTVRKLRIHAAVPKPAQDWTLEAQLC